MYIKIPSIYKFTKKILEKSNNTDHDIVKFIETYKSNKDFIKFHRVWKNDKRIGNVPRIEYKNEILCFTMLTHLQFINKENGTFENFLSIITTNEKISNESLLPYHSELKDFHRIWKKTQAKRNIPRIVNKDVDFVFTTLSNKKYNASNKIPRGSFEWFVNQIHLKNNVDTTIINEYKDVLLPYFKVWKEDITSFNSRKQSNIPRIEFTNEGRFIFTLYKTHNMYMRSITPHDKCYCQKCDTIMDLSKFSPNNRMHCVKCKSVYQTKFYHTIKGIKSQLYESVKSMNKQRGHSKFECEFLIFSNFLDENNINVLFDNWKSSGFKKSFVPSLKRIDGNKGYSMNNMVLMTYDENYNSSRIDLINGKGKIGESMTIPICSIDTKGNTRYHSSIRKAATYANVSNSTVTSAVKSRNLTKLGFKFQFADRHL